MKNKELLLDRNPQKSPVRFIFSHSALREGWDNPNVFQICALKQSSSDVRKRQEVGRGMRLCVNEDGDRMDENALGNDVHNINVLTVIASESYDKFAKGLQSEIAEAVGSRPRQVTEILFENAMVHDKDGNEETIDSAMAKRLIRYMIKMDYLDENDALTEKFYEDKANGEVQFGEEMEQYKPDLLVILDSIYDDKKMAPENARSNNVELKVDTDKLAMPEFKALWSRINAKTAYVVDFNTDELVRKAVAALDSKLRVPKIFFKVETGFMNEIKSKDELLSGASFVKEDSGIYGQTKIAANTSVKYDLVGKMVEETGLTRKAVVQILTGIQPSVFDQFKDNPEEFIIQAAKLINNEKATAIIQHITYDQAFYTGFPIYEDEENQRYIPALSTLVLLSSMNILNVLVGVKSNLLLPASYIDFFAERYSKAKETSLVSPGKLVNVDNQLTLIQNDLSHVEIWERIIDFCSDCEKVEISDDERIGFTLGDINGEQFIAAARLHMIHLDSFVLAKKEQATLLCDDLFFRKIATYGGIRNINFVSLLRHYVDDDFVVPIVMELSKTNYLYIPLMARTDEEAIELKKNILDGEMKKKFYSDILIAYNVAWKNVMREIFGEDVEFEETE